MTKIKGSLGATRGWSLLELVIVVAVLGILVALSIPAFNASQMRLRVQNMPREILLQIRLTRQKAMSERQSFTFRYDDVQKHLRIIDRQERGLTTTVPDITFRTTPLGGSGVRAADIKYGIPPGVSGVPTTLPDGTVLSALSSNRVEMVFQADGSVLDASSNPRNYALFFYHQQLPKESLAAISVLGASGRVKSWRYNYETSKWDEQ